MAVVAAIIPIAAVAPITVVVIVAVGVADRAAGTAANGRANKAAGAAADLLADDVTTCRARPPPMAASVRLRLSAPTMPPAAPPTPAPMVAPVEPPRCSPTTEPSAPPRAPPTAASVLLPAKGGAEQAGGGVLHGVIPYEELRRDPHVPLRFRQGLPDEMRDPVPVC